MARSSWRNWSGGVQATPLRVESPAAEAEIARLVAWAGEHRLQVRTAGAGHSFVPLCSSDGLLLDLSRLQGLIAADPLQGRGTLYAGTRLFDAAPALRAAGLGMINMGDIDRQTLGGAVSTGTHGTGPELGSLATQVVGMRLVVAGGEVLECSAEEDETRFRAAAVSLGALGVISRITLRLLPTYRLHERIWRLPFAECTEQLGELIESNRHFELFYYGPSDRCTLKALNPTDAEPDPLSEHRGERIDHWDRVFPSLRPVKFNEMELALPAAEGPACLARLRQLLRSRHPDVVWPLEYRTLGADELFLSPAHRRPSVTISAHQSAVLPYRRFFEDVEAICREHRGRPHWGKLHGHRAPELAELYPEWETFLAVRERLDPHGVFLNDCLRRLLYG